MHVISTAGIGVVAVLAISAPAPAAEWSITPALRLGYTYDDNLNMTLQPHDSVTGSVVSPKLDMGVQTKAWRIEGTAAVSRRNYSGAEDLDRNEQVLRLSSQRIAPRNSFAIDASNVREVLTSIEQEDPDFGLVTTERLRKRNSVKPAWTWSVTERSQLRVGYDWSDVIYEDGQSAGLYDYETSAVTAGLSYLLSRRDQFFINAYYSKYRVPEMSIQSQIPAQGSGITSVASDLVSRTSSFNVGIGHSFSHTAQGTLMLGKRRTEIEQTINTCVFSAGLFACPLVNSSLTKDSGTTFSGDLKKKFARLEFSMGASRDITIAGTGTVADADSVYLRLERSITTRLRGALLARGSRTSAIVGTETTNRRKYLIQPNLQWQWTREADLSLSYNYGHQKRDLEPQATQSHAVYLTLDYRWQKISISR